MDHRDAARVHFHHFSLQECICTNPSVLVLVSYVWCLQTRMSVRETPSPGTCPSDSFTYIDFSRKLIQSTILMGYRAARKETPRPWELTLECSRTSLGKKRRGEENYTQKILSRKKPSTWMYSRRSHKSLSSSLSCSFHTIQ